MKGIGLYLIACLFAMVAPFVTFESNSIGLVSRFPGWPTHHEGLLLEPVTLTHREVRFENGFPGRIAKFTDGKRIIIVRWVLTETRKLHPASDCFRGIGYRVRALPIRVDPNGVRWGCFTAIRGNEKVRVSERIYDDSGNHWTDVSAWYWAALLGQMRGPWWAETVIEDASAIDEDKVPTPHT